MDLKDCVCFITGGAQGLGKAYTEALLGQGAKVFFGDIDPAVGDATCEDLQKRFGKDRVRFCAFDVTDHGKYEEVFKDAVSTFGHVDILVNNAGILNEGAWQAMIGINYTAMVWGTKLAVEHMRTDKGGRGGRVVNISSIAGLREFPVCPIYAGTKHAVRAFTSSMAAQSKLGMSMGVQFGLICPDPVKTDLIHKLDNSRIHALDAIRPQMEAASMEPSTVVSAFLQLLQAADMNGQMVWVKKDGPHRVKVDMSVIEETS